MGGKQGERGIQGLEGPQGPPDKRRTYRDLWLFAITVVTVLALSHSSDAVHRVQEGRRVGNAALCAIASSISEAGRHTIVGASLAPETKLTRFLERHGYPPQKQRAAAAEQAGRDYVGSISARVEATIGRRGDGLIQPDGSINCRVLATITGTAPREKR